MGKHVPVQQGIWGRGSSTSQIVRFRSSTSGVASHTGRTRRNFFGTFS